MKKSRNRGVFLDKDKVRARAKLIDVLTLVVFEIRYIKHFSIPETQAVTAPKKAWNGQKMDKKYAKNIAVLLGLPDYLSLLPEQSLSPWSSLVKDKKHSASLMDFHLASDADKNLINTESFHKPSGQEPDKISVKQNWYLELTGKGGDCFMIVLQSRELTFQLAPLEFEGFVSTMPKRSLKLRYPLTKNFMFGVQYGLGWRCCTVIRAPYIPMKLRTGDTGFTLSSQELDDFALRLMQITNQQIAIDQYEFLLVE